jgi:hypothetical protein
MSGSADLEDDPGDSLRKKPMFSLDRGGIGFGKRRLGFSGH